jgi:putative acetyltransferase
MTEFLIREASDEDGPALARLIAGVFAEYPGCLYEPAEFPELDSPATWFAQRGGRLWVMVNDGAVAGSMGVVAGHRAGEFELLKVYLASAMRGQGFAAAMLAGALAFAQASGGQKLSLWSDTRFVEGHAFYRRQGFVRLPGVRALHDVSDTLEHRFARDVAPLAA